MAFNSLSYLIFLPVCVLLYWLMPARLRAAFLLLASYFVCFCWDIASGLTLFAVTLVAWRAALCIERGRRKRASLTVSLVLILGALCFFKYAQFALGSVCALARRLGADVSTPRLALFLPVGISFYAFKSAGYLMDVYRGKTKAEPNAVTAALFIGFFPPLVSGPIDRADSLMTQLRTLHRPNYTQLMEGLLLFLWGLFLKLVLADNLAVLINSAYADVYAHTGFQLAAAALCYSIQIYCDFAAYTDMARGSALMLGISLMKNFDAPYFAPTVQNFWRRWHISLSTWFRDYLYFPLGGSRCGRARHIFNVMVVFAVSGLWHGAAWTFVLWGLLHGVYQAVEILWRPVGKRLHAALRLPERCRWLQGVQIVVTFLLVTWAWILFRADTLGDALHVMGAVFQAPQALASGYFGLSDLGLGRRSLAMLAVSVCVLLAVELRGRRIDLAGRLAERPAPRFLACFLLIAAVLLFGAYGPGFDPQSFVYFKF